MDAQQQRDLITGLFAHIALLRKDLQWIGDTTQDPSTKLQVRYTLQKSLTMPPEPGAMQMLPMHGVGSSI
jgi:hypothetical protein